MKSAPPLTPVTLALESATHIDGNLEVRGIDLDSGHRVSVTVRYEYAAPQAGTKLNGLILSLSVVESPLSH